MAEKENPWDMPVKPDPETLLKENGIIRGIAKGEIKEAPANYMAEKIADPRRSSHEPYTPYPSDDVKWPRPDVKPVRTPPKDLD